MAGKATRDTLFLSSFPVDALPMAMIAAAATSVAAVALFSSGAHQADAGPASCRSRSAWARCWLLVEGGA